MKEKIVTYIKKEIVNGSIKHIQLQDDLLGTGIIDSMNMMKLLVFVEKEASIKIPPEDMTVQNFMTVENILSYLSSRKNEQLNESKL